MAVTVPDQLLLLCVAVTVNESDVIAVTTGNISPALSAIVTLTHHDTVSKGRVYVSEKLSDDPLPVIVKSTCLTFNMAGTS
jgi:hypothetical protein